MSHQQACSTCKGKGRLPAGPCCCGTGEGCTLHNATAISLWGTICSACNGTGKDVAVAQSAKEPQS